MERILLVCTGNTCRSSMAEGILKDLLKAHDVQMKVQSAGTSVLFHEPANEKAVAVMKEMGIHIEDHLSQPLNEALVREADIILTMTYAHKENILHRFPKSKEKVFTLKEQLAYLQGKRGLQQSYDSNMDIMDPYGGNIEKYRKTAIEIRDVLEKILLLMIDAS